MTDEFRIGDAIECLGPNWAGPVSGYVETVGKTRLKMKVRIRWSPSGPWFEQVHEVSKSWVTILIRDFEVVFDRRPEEDRLRRPMNLQFLEEEKKKCETSKLDRI